jgi:hypothetical protein
MRYGGWCSALPRTRWQTGSHNGRPVGAGEAPLEGVTHPPGWWRHCVGGIHTTVGCFLPGALPTIAGGWVTRPYPALVLPSAWSEEPYHVPRN